MQRQGLPSSTGPSTMRRTGERTSSLSTYGYAARLRSLLRIALVAGLALSVLPGCGVLVEPDRELIENGERGVLGGYQGGTVFGWAIGDDDAPVLVRLSYVAEETVVSADQPREDLALEEGIPSGAAGFELEVGALPAGSKVRAFIVESGLELTNSPLTVEPPAM